MSQGNYIDGLHRPYNIPLKEVVWVCTFIKNETKRLEKKYLNVAFWKFFIYSHIEQGGITSDNDTGIISIEKALIVKQWIEKYPSLDNLSDAVSDILKKRNDKVEKIVYSSYKNTSYYITLTRKLGLLHGQWELTQDALKLVRINRSFYGLSRSQKQIIFEKILQEDKDFILPILFSLWYEQRMPSVEDGDLVLRYLQEEEKFTFFKYIRKSILPNYYKVRRCWIEELEVLDKHKKLKKNPLKTIYKLFDRSKVQKDMDKFSEFASRFLVIENNNSKKFEKFEEQYYKLIQAGKSDSDYVNLYEMKKAFRLSFDNFEKLIVSYMIDVSMQKIVLLSNTVMSIDSRRRFIINGVPAIKIKILNKKK